MAVALGRRLTPRVLAFVVLATGGCFVPDKKDLPPAPDPDGGMTDPDARCNSNDDCVLGPFRGVCGPDRTCLNRCWSGHIDLDNNPTNGCEYSCTPIPSREELCNANEADDDCDGVTDEGCACEPGAERPCGREQGLCRSVQRCVNSRWAACTQLVGPTAEVCDGQDNNCDGEKDEGFDLHLEHRALWRLR